MTRHLLLASLIVGFICGLAAAAEVTVKPGHQKLSLTKDDIARAARNIRANGANWQRLKANIDAGTAPVPAFALVYLATGDEAVGRKGVEVLMNPRTTSVEDISLGYDWLFPLLAADQRQALFDRVSKAVEKDFAEKPSAPWSNFVQRSCLRLALAGCAFTPDFPDAKKWADKAYTDWEEFHLPAARITGDGGGWPEGTLYSYIVYSSLTRLADCFWTATDKDPYQETPWFADRLVWWRFHVWPLPKDFRGVRNFYMYDPYGDSERWRAPMQNQEIAAELLTMRYLDAQQSGVVASMPYVADAPEFVPRADAVKEWRWFMKALGTPIVSLGDWSLLAYYDETAPTQEPVGLSHYAKGTGQIFIRSSWKPDATWLSLQCGPRFTYHQHLDQGQVKIFKTGDLTGESGVYEPSGPSEQDGHLQGYASRAIAHNTINVYNPDEVFSGYRSGNSPRNDGGQRTWRPFSNTADKAAGWQGGFARGAYDTGTITEFSDDGNVVYCAMDLTGAYNSDKYASEPNKSKVHEITRQVVYFRPQAEGDVDCVMVFDRVRAVDPSFEKRILWHFPNDVSVSGSETRTAEGEYTCDGDLAQTDTGGGRLFIRSVWPKGAKINKVGGPDKEYWVFGRNFPVPETPWERGYGKWRIEIMPAEKRADDCFLTVLFPTDKSVPSAPIVERRAGANTVGADVLLDGKLYCRADFSKEGPAGANILGGTAWSVGFKVKVVKQFGDKSAVDDTARAEGKVDTAFPCPSIRNLKVSDVTTEAVVSWETDAPTTGYVEFGNDPEMRYIIDAFMVTGADKAPYGFKAALRGLAPASKFYVRAAARDDKGRVGFSKMLDLATPPDTTAPKISSLTAGQVDPEGATFSWSTDDLATGSVEFTSEIGEKITADTKTPAADQTVIAAGLKPGAKYTVVVTTRNAGGLEATSEPFTLTTPEAMTGYFRTGFDDGNLAGFSSETLSAWSVGKDSASGSMALSVDNPDKKRKIIVYDGNEYGDFTIRCRARTVEGDGNKWRDFMVIFGYKDPANYYLAGFNSSVDVDVPGIVRIKDGAAAPIADRVNIVTIPDRAWHDIMITRRGAHIEVYWDGLLAFRADDSELGRGKVGFGSFNDAAAFDDLTIIPSAPESTRMIPFIRTKKLTVEGLVME